MVDRIVTDRFEQRHFQRDGWTAQCAPPRDRKVYWIAPGREADLGPRVDAWLVANEPWLRELRARWFGEATDWTELDHLIDLLTRRLAMMPSVGAYKRAHGLPIEDREREERVLQASARAAHNAGLEPGSVDALFRLQIDLAKRIQRRDTQGEPLDLNQQLRPTLIALGARLTLALAATAAQLAQLSCSRLEPMSESLQPEELAQLCDALTQVRAAQP